MRLINLSFLLFYNNFSLISAAKYCAVFQYDVPHIMDMNNQVFDTQKIKFKRTKEREQECFIHMIAKLGSLDGTNINNCLTTHVLKFTGGVVPTRPIATDEFTKNPCSVTENEMICFCKDSYCNGPNMYLSMLVEHIFKGRVSHVSLTQRNAHSKILEKFNNTADDNATGVHGQDKPFAQCYLQLLIMLNEANPSPPYFHLNYVTTEMFPRNYRIEPIPVRYDPLDYTEDTLAPKLEMDIVIHADGGVFLQILKRIEVMSGLGVLVLIGLGATIAMLVLICKKLGNPDAVLRECDADTTRAFYKLMDQATKSEDKKNKKKKKKKKKKNKKMTSGEVKSQSHEELLNDLLVLNM